MLLDDYTTKLTDTEQAILLDLYYYRVMTTEQIKKRHFNNSGTYVNKVLWKLRKNGYIKSRILKNSRENKKGYSYHRLTETGLECLIKHDTSVEGEFNHYVKPSQVPYILLANNIVTELSNTDWEIWDSRKVKKVFNFDKRMNIQGLLISPEKKKYGLYVMGKNTTPKTIGKIKSEISAHSPLLLQDYMIISQGLNAYKDFIDYAINHSNGQSNEPLSTGHSIKIFLSKVFYAIANSFHTEVEWMQRLCDYYQLTLKSTKIKEGERQSFPYIVERNGKEYYLVDLTDSDLLKYQNVTSYARSISSRNWEKRDIIVVTLSIPTKMNLSIEKLPNVDLQTLTGKEIDEICFV